MRLECSIKKLIVLAVCISSVFCGGCRREILEYGRWAEMIAEDAGFAEDGGETFEQVQAGLTQYGVIGESDRFEPNDPVTRELAAYMLSNLAGISAERTCEIHDLQNSPYREEIENAVALGIFEECGRFDPARNISASDAEEALEKTIHLINHRTFENTASFEWKDPEHVYEIDIQSLDVQDLSAPVPDAAVCTGDLIFTSGPYDSRAYTVADINDGEMELREADLSEYLENMKVSGSQTADFSQARIIAADGTPVQEGNAGISHTSFHPMTNTFSVNGFEVTIHASSNALSASLKRGVLNGAEAYGEIRISGFRADYAWNMLDDSYLKFSFVSSENIGIRRTDEQNRYADLSSIDPENFLQSVRSMFREEDDTVQTTFTVCTVEIPVSGCPAVNISLSINLNLYASGRAELTFSQDNTLGFEIRNGAMRLIRESNNDHDCLLRADLSALTGVNAGISVFHSTLMDAELQAGLKASVHSTVHLYDEDGNMHTVQSDLPADYVDDAASVNPDVLVCADVSGSWIVNLQLNSSGSFAGKLGMGADLSLLNADNAPLIPGIAGHYENWHAVDHCTRTSRPKISDLDEVEDTEQIRIEKYQMTIPIGGTDTLIITDIPDGYSEEDLVFSSTDPRIASISSSGVIAAHSSGSAIMIVRTDDSMYTVRCTVIVPEASA